MDYSNFLGTWMNTLRKGHTIDYFRLFEDEGALMIEVQKSGSVSSWGKAPMQLFWTEKEPQKITAFEAKYDLGETEHNLSIYENKGLMVVATFHRIKDNSDRKPFFTREFFIKET